MTEHRVLWISTSLTTRGGIASFVNGMRQTPLWTTWNVRHVATHQDGSAPAKVAIFLRGARTVLWELAVRPPDVMHIHMSSYGSFVRKSLMTWAGWLRRVPVVVHMHGSEFDVFFARCPRVVQIYISGTLNRSRVLIALGDTWAERLARIAPRAPIVVVPNAVKPQCQTRQPSGREPITVLFLGNIGDRKGAFTLIDAWSRVFSDWSGPGEPRLVLAGDGQVERASRRIIELGLSTHARVVGWASPADVEELLRSSQILVLPSRSEGQPMAVLEAMAHGLCIVATQVGGLSDMIDPDCAVVVPLDDPGALADGSPARHGRRSRAGAPRCGGSSARSRPVRRRGDVASDRRVVSRGDEVSTAGRLRVVHVVPDLGVGGAERHAATLMSHLDPTLFAPSLVCIGRRGELFDTLDPAVHAVALGRTKLQACRTVLDLVRIFRGLSPDLVIVRGFNAECLGRVAAVLARVRHTVVWVHNCGDVEPRGAPSARPRPCA